MYQLAEEPDLLKAVLPVLFLEPLAGHVIGSTNQPGHDFIFFNVIAAGPSSAGILNYLLAIFPFAFLVIYLLFRSGIKSRRSRIEMGRLMFEMNSRLHEQAKAEKAFSGEEQEYQLMLKRHPDLMIKTDPEGRFLSVSRTFCEMFGRKREELIGTMSYPEIHEEDRERSALQREALFNPPHTCRFEQRVRAKDGWRCISWSDVAELDARGNVRAVIGVGRDITELKEANEEMLLAKKAVDCAADLVFWIKPDGRFVYVNETSCLALGFTEEELLQKSISDIDQIYDISKFMELFRELKKRKNMLVESILKAKWGRQVPVEIKVNHVLFGDKEYMIAFARDITYRKKAAKELSRAFSEITHLKEQLEAENVVLKREIGSLGHRSIIGESTVMKRVMSQVTEVAGTNSTVLITGETGTGKELIARAIHEMSGRRDRPLVTVNCAAMPSTLIESELFGREKGAYTGAFTRQVGRFEIANGSTIFLDEIGELSLESQAKLLRIIQEGEFERLGSTKTIKVDTRIIAATNSDLEKAVEESRFRRDLFFRLNVFPIEVPPLRERRGDIPLLVWHFVFEFIERMGKSIESIPRPTMEKLQEYSWPGNVRELKNVIERGMIMTRSTTLRLTLPKARHVEEPNARTLDEALRNHILKVLEDTRWRIRGRNGAAEILDVNPSTLESRMNKLGIDKPAGKAR